MEVFHHHQSRVDIRTVKMWSATLLVLALLSPFSSVRGDGDKYWWMNQQEVFSGSGGNYPQGQQGQQAFTQQQQGFGDDFGNLIKDNNSSNSSDVSVITYLLVKIIKIIFFLKKVQHVVVNNNNSNNGSDKPLSGTDNQ